MIQRLVLIRLEKRLRLECLDEDADAVQEVLDEARGNAFMSSATQRLFHKLWTKAVGTTGYSKYEWIELERALRTNTAASEVVPL